MDAGEKKKRMPMKNAGDEREFAKEVTKKKNKDELSGKKERILAEKKDDKKIQERTNKEEKKLIQNGTLPVYPALLDI